MLIVDSFLQRVFQMVKSIATKVTKRMYRQAAVFISGVAVMTVIMLTSSDFGGSGKNALTVFADTKVLEVEEVEDSEEDVQVELTDAIRQGQVIVGDQLEKTLQKRREELSFVSVKAEETRETMTAVAIEAAETALPISKSGISYSPQDYEVLLRIVQAEAGICDDKGKILVANVILNRVKNAQFPDNITDVVYQKSQFSPVSNGSINTVKITQQTIDCVNRALSGEDYSQGAMYFMYREGSQGYAVDWFDGRLTFLFQHERHEFFK